MLSVEVEARDVYDNKVMDQPPNVQFVAQFSNGLVTNFTAGPDGLYQTKYAIERQGTYSIQVLFVNESVSLPIQGTPPIHHHSCGHGNSHHTRTRPPAVRNWTRLQDHLGRSVSLYPPNQWRRAAMRSARVWLFQLLATNPTFHWCREIVSTTPFTRGYRPLSRFRATSLVLILCQ